jgi:hypothetical protein
MKRMLVLVALALLTAGALATVAPAAARADGCYICGSGSTDACKDYCRYTGDDTWDARKACEAKGCKVSGTASCPTAVNYKVCQAPDARIALFGAR